MTENDLKMYEFIRKLRVQADEYYEIAENRTNMLGYPLWASRAEAFREIANMLETEFRDN